MRKPKITIDKIIRDPRCKPEFDAEALLNSKHVSPEAARCIEFDWEVLRQLMDEAKDEICGRDYEALAAVLREFLQWVCRDDDLERTGRRAQALAWVINPGMVGSPTTAELAERLGVHTITLRRDTGEASRITGHRNRAQKNAANWKDQAPGHKESFSPEP